jgi:Clp amino terminal domain, pathogenicity island component
MRTDRIGIQHPIYPDQQVGTEHVLLGLVMEATAAATRRAKAGADTAADPTANPDVSYLGLGITPEAAHAANAWVRMRFDVVNTCMTA